MTKLHSAFTLFLSLLVEAMPFLLLGVLLSSLLLFFIDERKLITKLPSNPIMGAIVGSCVGFLFPVCECGNVPVARRLIIKGVPTSIAISFLLAAPTINPIVIWSTWVAFRDRPEIVIFRIIFSFAIATIIGCIFSVQKDPHPLLQTSLMRRLNTSNSIDRIDSKIKEKNLGKVPALLQSGTFILNPFGTPIPLDNSISTVLPNIQSLSFSRKIRPFLDNLVQEFREMGGMLVIGSAIAAFIQVFIPRELVLGLGQGTISSIVAMIFLALIVSICSTVDSFFALSFSATFTTSSIVAFLVFGPMVDIKSVGLMLSIFKPKIIFYIFALAAQLTFIFTFVFNYFF